MILKCKKSEISIDDEVSLTSQLTDFFTQESVIRLEKNDGSFLVVTPTGDKTYTFEFKENGKAFFCLTFYSTEIVTEVFTKFFKNETDWSDGYDWEEVTGASIWHLIIFLILLSSGIAFYGWNIGQLKQYGTVSGGIILILIISLIIVKDPRSNGFALSCMKNLIEKKNANSQK